MRYVVVIPARLKSTRLPEKPLIDLFGQSMIQRTYNQCLKAVDKSLLYIATDSDKIADHCTLLGMNVIMTSDSCLTGTDRIAEFSKKINAEYYINVQGDEPLINPDDIRIMINSLDAFDGEILNGYASIDNSHDYESRSVPKLVFRKDKRLMYMSRSPIPGNKSASFEKAYRQICIYGFPKKALEDFSKEAHKTLFEDIEDIEIVRFLELGYDVRMIEMSADSIAVDNPEDVEKVLNKLKNVESN
jgi:3-deoxy-manno-octulosonate cytidylyltransferase (CMP-KDO synthetase)